MAACQDSGGGIEGPSDAGIDGAMAPAPRVDRDASAVVAQASDAGLVLDALVDTLGEVGGRLRELDACLARVASWDAGQWPAQGQARQLQPQQQLHELQRGVDLTQLRNAHAHAPAEEGIVVFERGHIGQRAVGGSFRKRHVATDR